jgi:hypothetical protein
MEKAVADRPVGPYSVIVDRLCSEEQSQYRRSLPHASRHHRAVYGLSGACKVHVWYKCGRATVGRSEKQLSSVNFARGTCKYALTSYDGRMMLRNHLVCPGKIFQIVTSSAILSDSSPCCVDSSSSSDSS